MAEVYFTEGTRAVSAKRGNELPRREIECPSELAIVYARARWPRKTAANWAAEAGVKERAVKYWLQHRDVPNVGRRALARGLEII